MSQNGPQSDGASRRQWIWPLLGVLTVVIPALIVGAIAWRNSVAASDAAAARASSANPGELSLIYLGAASDDDKRLLAETLDPGLDKGSTGYAALTDPGLRGSNGQSVTDERVDGSKAVVRVRLSTTRPLADGTPPGPLRGTVGLVNESGRWYVTSLAVAD